MHVFKLVPPLMLLSSGSSFAPPSDLLIYGSTPAGVAAAAAFRACAGPAATITLLDPGSRVGGMSSSGLGNSDVGPGRGAELGGFARAFFVRNHRVYDPNASSPLYLLEPHVAEGLFLATLTDAGVTLVSGASVASVTVKGTSLDSITTSGGVTFSARYFIDASYEGDLLGAAGLSFVVGREPQAQYGEARGGRLGGNYTFVLPINPYDDDGALLPLMSTVPFAREGAGDGLLQSFCFRLCVTNTSSLRIPFPAPATYVHSDFELFHRWVAASPPSLQSFFGYAFPIPSREGSHKWDLNSDFAVSFDYVGASVTWPTANASVRRVLWEAHRQYTLSLIHVLQHDLTTPPSVRAEALEWGLCRDEFRDTGGWPPQLYVREGRRLVGDVVFTGVELDTGRAPRNDSIGLGSYAMDVHHVERVPCIPRHPLPEGPFPIFPRHAVMCDMLQPNARPPPNTTVWVAMEGHGGPIGAPDDVFEMPYTVLLPKRVEAINLLSPTAPSASHVAFNSFRLEAQFMILGQAAGAAAALALEARGAVQDVEVPALQAELERQGARLHW